MNSVLLDADKKGDISTVQALLDKGADVNAQNKNGWTALKIVKDEGLTEAVEFLKLIGAKE